jgi:hypothetical protein
MCTFVAFFEYKYLISGHIAALFASCLEIANYPTPIRGRLRRNNLA